MSLRKSLSILYNALKERLTHDIPKYNSRTHTVVSSDAIKLYTNVNVNRVISHVSDCIFITPSLFLMKKLILVDLNLYQVEIISESLLRMF